MSIFVININGEFFSEKDAKISVFDRGFLYSDSIYEATRTFNRRAFRLESHLDRLFSSAEKIQLIPSLTKAEIQNEIEKTIEAAKHPNLAIRIVLTRGTNRDLGLDPNLATQNNLIIYAKEIAPNPPSWLTEGVSLGFYQKQNSVSGSLPKTGNYQENMLAYKQAREQGFYDAIMINPEGFITESTTSNIWLVKNNVIFTPDLSLGVLEGLTRKTLFEIAARDGFQIKTSALLRQDFLGADECFITSTTRNLVPVTKIDQVAIGTGLPGTKTLELLKTYLEFVSGR